MSSGVDPREVLGVGPDAEAAEITAAFRRLAKRWHPDHAADAATNDRMALLNAAYAALRAPAPAPEPPPRPDPAAAPAAAVRRADLAPAVRRALGAELRRAIEPGEDVGLVVPASTWASPQTTLAVTGRRLLWLLDDAPVHRVRTLALGDVTDVRVRPPRPWRRRAQVVVTDRRGRRTTFGELPLPTAAAVARRIGAGR
ncbi:J domain-containing protein [Patulibacter sp. SYSU D01012]|uniref:J domain-containing protein n=1 Tax=Patulibacter sp. SYSU D01012 TaxID=2817381 RepID=UPI001B3142FB